MFFILNSLKKYNIYNDYSKITDNIFLGNKYAAFDLKFLEENEIKVIVNCSKNIDFIESDYYIKHRIPVNDDLSNVSINIMSIYMKDLIPIINKYINKNYKIFIHCRAGMQRSAAFLCALLIYRYKMNKIYAMQYIKNKRSCAFLPFCNFGLSIDIYENYLNQKFDLN